MVATYDDKEFFDAYAQMSRSRDGLAGAGEWHQLRKLFPDLTGKQVLDLGCGYGWHCRYAADRGAARVLGIDVSRRMLDEAERQNGGAEITYRLCGIEEYEYPEENYDCVVSNLALHYLRDLDSVFRKIYRTLKPGGSFLLNIEHPVFTAGVNEDWIYDGAGQPLYWPVDRYFESGPRETRFLGKQVPKEHHTLTQILMGLRKSGFALDVVEEAEPDPDMLDLPGMRDELRRPMMLLIRAEKENGKLF